MTVGDDRRHDRDREELVEPVPRRMQTALEETIGAVRATAKATEREFRGLFGRPKKPGERRPGRG